jgi:hypothetical protein
VDVMVIPASVVRAGAESDEGGTGLHAADGIRGDKERLSSILSTISDLLYAPHRAIIAPKHEAGIKGNAPVLHYTN